MLLNLKTKNYNSALQIDAFIQAEKISLIKKRTYNLARFFKSNCCEIYGKIVIGCC
jgi:hypothetical protein